MILMEGRRKEAGVRAQSWELSMEQGEPEVEARAVTRTTRANMSAMVYHKVGHKMKGHLNSGSA